LVYTLSSNSNPALFSSTPIAGSTLTLNPAGPPGSATLFILATDSVGRSAVTSFTVTVAVPAPRVAQAQVNGGAAQRSRVTDLTVTFSTQVTFATTPGAAFTLTRNSDGAAVSFTATATVVGGVTVVTLNGFTGAATQFGSLADGRYTLTALANQITAGGQPLDGNGDGTGGDNYTFGDAQGLFRFYGDANGDRRVDVADLGAFAGTYLKSSGDPGFLAYFDFNADGRIDVADLGQFAARYLMTLP